MSAAKHTPGPWTFYRESSCDRGDSYGVKAPAPHYWVVPTLNINPADAHLMAAAPKLLEALEDLMEMTGEPPDRNCSCHISPPCNDCVDYSEWRDAFEYARAAIAKATGGAA